MPTPEPDPRELVAIDLVPDPIPRGLFDSLITAFADVATDYGLTIGGRILGEAGTTRRTGGSAEVRRIRERFADQSETIAELRDELALAQKVAGAADHLLAGRDVQPTTINTWLAHRFRTLLETRTAELATALQRVAELEAENEAVDQGRPEALDQLLAAVAQALPEQTPEERAEWAERNYRRAHRVAVRATKRVDELASRLETARRDGDRLASDLTHTHVRLRDAEAQVAAVRTALDDVYREIVARTEHPFGGQISEAVRQGMAKAAEPIREALDAASAPAEPGISSAATSASTPPHTGQDCPDRIEVTGWGMTDREWICGCDPRPDATAPAETTSPSEAP